jgi:hypothetical protein
VKCETYRVGKDHGEEQDQEAGDELEGDHDDSSKGDPVST